MRLTNFFGDVGREMKKVSWPKKDELLRINNDCYRDSCVLCDFLRSG